jgi:hypothetical protein
MLALRMRGHWPISPRGAAKTKILLTDGSGPLYNPHGSADLETAARSALAALDGGSGQERPVADGVGNPGR